MEEGKIYKFKNSRNRIIRVSYKEVYVDVFEVTLIHDKDTPPYEEFIGMGVGKGKKGLAIALKNAVKRYNSNAAEGYRIRRDKIDLLRKPIKRRRKTKRRVINVEKPLL